MKTTKIRKIEIVNQLAAVALDAHRRGDIAIRNQAEKNIYDAAPTVKYADAVIRNLYAAK